MYIIMYHPNHVNNTDLERLLAIMEFLPGRTIAIPHHNNYVAPLYIINTEAHVITGAITTEKIG